MPETKLRGRGPATVLLLTAALSAGCAPGDHPAADPGRWCDALPRPANAALEAVPAGNDWFDVRRVADGVFALIEGRQFQETISYLITGRDRALLFDTGLGLVPIRPVVERLTPLPVTVINSHTHYDHVGGNAEFDAVLAMDGPYTRANQAGFPHAELAGEVAADAICATAPATADTAGFLTRPWTATGTVQDGQRIDLGGRTIDVLVVPGHTPDALALLDRDAGLLWTGDTYYDATIWLFVPETDLDAWERSMVRLAGLADSVRLLLPAHNTAAAEPVRLAEALAAYRQIRRGEARGEDQDGRRRVFRFPRFSFLIATPLLAGETGSRTAGGSGLTTWP